MAASESISVVIPCYNYAHFLGEAIDSVLAQTLQPREIIVVDDGSTDNTAEVARGFERVKYMWKPNGGRSSARNFGIERSEGTNLIFLDADDLLRPRALEILLDALGRAGEGVGAVFGLTELLRQPKPPDAPSVEYFPDPDEVAVLAERQLTDDLALLSAGVFKRLLRSSIIAICTLVPRATFEAVGPFDEDLASIEDQDMWLRVAARFRLAFVNRTIADYRRHGANVTDSSNWIRNRRNILRVQDKAARADWASLGRRLLARRQYARTADLLSARLADEGDFADAARQAAAALRRNPLRPRTWARLLAYSLIKCTRRGGGSEP